MSKLFTILFAVMLPITAMATDVTAGDDFISYEEIINQSRDNTECATRVFADALAQTADQVSESDSELAIKQWITATFSDKAVLTRVLECPEIAKLADDDTIRFMPIVYNFPGGREIVINYETQPKIFKQRILLADKQSMPISDPNPRIGADDTVWANVDPAWYAIMVTEHGALDNFVGPDKNNTVALRYIYQNIDSLYPSHNGGQCTDRSAFTDSDTAINQVMTKKTINVPEDESEYYIAGDVSLKWLSYLEIAFDVGLTIVTTGAFKGVQGMLKYKQMQRTSRVLFGNIRKLETSEDVIKYTKATKELDNLNAARKAKQADMAKLEKQIQEQDELVKTLSKEVEAATANIEIATKNAKVGHISKAHKDAFDAASRLKKNQTLANSKLESLKNNKIALQKELDDAAINITKAEDNLKDLEKTKDVKLLNESTKELKELETTMEAMKAFKGLRKMEQTGNVLVRTTKNAVQSIKALRTTLKAINTSNKTIKHAARVGRMGMRSGRTRDWLFHTTMRNAGKLAKVGQNAGMLYGAIKLVGGMYDWTETSTGDFTNNIDFKPLLLLSADDIKGQENVVNHGMWLMWAGDSMSPTDDDAAFLQAMDFASKFHEDLMEHQNDGNHPCNIDIWVVRPVIREPGTANQELYYLIMNDHPWTTAN